MESRALSRLCPESLGWKIIIEISIAYNFPLLTHRNGGTVFPRASRAYPVHGGDQAEDGTGEGHERGHDAQGEESQQLEIKYNIYVI